MKDGDVLDSGSTSRSGSEAAWTQWKTLHHQTKDLSPWMTEAVSLNHVQTSLKKGHEKQQSSPFPISLEEETPAGLGEEIHAPIRQLYWKRYVIIAATIFWSASTHSLR